MAIVHVTIELLDTLLHELAKAHSDLDVSRKRFPDLYPEGLTLRNMQNIHDALPAIIELAGRLSSQLQIREAEIKMRMESSKTKRNRRRYGGATTTPRKKKPNHR
jgi:hypothetical protein